MKIAELEGIRYLKRIECDCGENWDRTGDKKKDSRERQRFINKHGSHNLKHVFCNITTLTH